MLNKLQPRVAMLHICARGFLFHCFKGLSCGSAWPSSIYVVEDEQSDTAPLVSTLCHSRGGIPGVCTLGLAAEDVVRHIQGGAKINRTSSDVSGETTF